MSSSEECSRENWVHHKVPRALPVGQGHIQPPTTPHAISSSLPTWDSVIAWARREKGVRDKAEYSYPRFFIGKPIQNLIHRVRERLHIRGDTISSMVFPSIRIANYCAGALKAALKTSCPDAIPDIYTIRFFLPFEARVHEEENTWTDFSVVVFPTDLAKESMLAWMDTGAGITTRHAQFCLESLDFLASDSTCPSFQTLAPLQRHRESPTLNPWRLSAPDDLLQVRAYIAHLITSERPELKRVSAEDVLLFPTGIHAIFSASEALAALAPNSDVVAYGWLYPETVHVLRRSPWNRAISFKWGTDKELDELENMLKNPGHHVTALFCEIPSNIKFISPNLERIRHLADEYNFIVACDETAGNFVNLDILPFVDVVLSSLTKMFSGASDSTPSSVVVNPNSRHYTRIQSQLAIQHESVYCFPGDVAALKRNSANMAARVRRSNANAVPVVEFLQQHPSVKQVSHPSLGPTSRWYTKHMRREGGYGNVLGVVMRDPKTARGFYDNLDVCKGSSFGTNFTLAVPYVQLACYWDQDKCEEYGLPRHVIRISVGLEDAGEIVGKIRSALEEAEKGERGNLV
ncbi:cystathionine gamma-synthase [Metarhizium robertsii ARSEF 23]|uniref:Cystathionine gamma-synthase n=1 Tax=Metarhizium robertsii (strain ARSEF 23 / ATCC MYA-3075) TaxID=655844 RepID=E9ELI1_METRA|nr:cystathionine gamma-synthase [Metarhizium robertsii ARSEF 23]EFZ03959.1 cystathionine gamma-synthase [Metarhizium robertsii ARSEF 23]